MSRLRRALTALGFTRAVVGPIASEMKAPPAAQPAVSERDEALDEAAKRARGMIRWRLKGHDDLRDKLGERIAEDILSLKRRSIIHPAHADAFAGSWAPTLHRPNLADVFRESATPAGTVHVGRNLLLPVAIIATNHDRVVLAMEHLRTARELLKEAGAVRTVERVRSALKSADGARRHALGLEARQREADERFAKRRAEGFVTVGVDDYVKWDSVYVDAPHGGCPDCETTGVCEEHPFPEQPALPEGADVVISAFREGSYRFEDAVTDLILSGMLDSAARAALFATGEWLVDNLVWRGPNGQRWLVDADGYLAEPVIHTADTCPSKHWNDGRDVCMDCGENLAGSPDGKGD